MWLPGLLLPTFHNLHALALALGDRPHENV